MQPITSPSSVFKNPTAPAACLTRVNPALYTWCNLCRPCPLVYSFCALQVRAPLEKKLAEEPTFLQTLAADIAKLAAELAALGVAVNGSA